MKRCAAGVLCALWLGACSTGDGGTSARPSGSAGPGGALAEDARDDDPHATGLLPPTPEEVRWVQEHALAPGKVRPNALALSRIQGERQARGLSPLPVERIEAAWRLPAVPPPLPAVVDNSLLDAFPPIRSQGSLGSCASFSATYYQLTHTVALARGWNAKSGGDNYRFSPRWTYNLVNGGEDAGSTGHAPFSLIEKTGAATWAQFPYNGSDYRSWVLDKAVWRSALQYRFGPMGSASGLDKSDGLRTLKQLLANGHVLNLNTYVNSWQFISGGIKDDPATAADDAFVGQAACHWMNGANGPHAMTIVGYHDELWIDINANGAVDDGEKGALKIANSWGTGWGTGGYAWIAYDALRDESRVAGAPSVGRIGAFTYALWTTVRPDQRPLLTAEVTLTHGKRNQLLLALGTGAVGDTAPAQTWYPGAPFYSGGPYAFDGSATPVPATFVLDFSDLAAPDGTARRYFLYVRDNLANDPADVAAFSLVDELHGTTLAAGDLPQSVDNAERYFWVDYTFSSANTPPTIGAIPDQLIPMNGSADDVPFAVSDAETAPEALAVWAETDASWNGLLPAAGITFGGSGANRTLSIRPAGYQIGSTRARIRVSDGEATGESSFWVHVSRAGNTPPSVSAIPDQTTPAGSATAAIPFTVGDAETPLDDLKITLSGSGMLLGHEIAGSGASRTLRLCPRSGVEGSEELALLVTDGELTAERRFRLTVTPRAANTPPSISIIPDQATTEGTPTPPIPFVLSDAETDPAFLQLYFDCDDWRLLPYSRVSFAGQGANRSVTLCPASGQTGTALITLSVWDGQEPMGTTQFRLTVGDAANTPPTLSAIPDQLIPAGGTTGPIPFTVSDAETPPEFFEVTFGCDNWDLISWSGIRLGGSGGLRTVEVTPYVGERGTAEISLQTSDGEFSASVAFRVTVDASLTCGNFELDPGETCDPPSRCPTSCADVDPCTDDTMSGSPASCDATCPHDPVMVCLSGDGCCPAGCHGGNDTDCPPVCGNSYLDPEETCDPPTTCPASCDDGDACTADQLLGETAACTARCESAPITSCGAGDGCCPVGCHGGNDADCPAVCGNSYRDPGESCDPPTSCPTSCDDGDVCTADRLEGAAAECTAHCLFDAISACVSGDGCCPAACDHASDADCSPDCGNGHIDPNETCDPPSSCPTSCDDGDNCTSDTTTGSAANCNVRCNHAPVQVCQGGDGCCPAGCELAADADCAPVCGNSRVDANETCDPPASCPASCDDGDACTADRLEGAATECTARCVFEAISACVSGDGCCPTGCRAAQDGDCHEPGGKITGGCGCTTSESEDSLAWLILALAITLRRRR